MLAKLSSITLSIEHISEMVRLHSALKPVLQSYEQVLLTYSISLTTQLDLIHVATILGWVLFIIHLLVSSLPLILLAVNILVCVVLVRELEAQAIVLVLLLHPGLHHQTFKVLCLNT